jgi:hypothetical protein
MGLKNAKTFSDEEVAAAFRFLMSAEAAEQEAVLFNSGPDLHDFESATPQELAEHVAKGPRSYDGDFLDLISLVSDDCARRAWGLLGITEAQGRTRRDAFRLRLRAGG